MRMAPWINGIALSRALFVALGIAAAGCTSIELAPDKFPLRGPRVDPSETGELVVIANGDPLGSKSIWLIYVDDVPRAWMPTGSSFTRIPIVPGRRNVRVALRHRNLEVLLVPFPWTTEHTAHIHLECAQAKPCGIVALGYIDRRRNEPAVDIKELDAETIRADVLSIGLPSYVPPDQ
jgi:hypothetical protein